MKAGCQDSYSGSAAAGAAIVILKWEFWRQDLITLNRIFFSIEGEQLRIVCACAQMCVFVSVYVGQSFGA